jgi:hypothetical protein
LFHIGESLSGWHNIVLDSAQVWFLAISALVCCRDNGNTHLGVLETEEGDTSMDEFLVPGEILVDFIDTSRHMVVSLVE